MPPQKLRAQRISHVFQRKIAGVIGHLRVEQHLQQQVAQFIAKIVPVAPLDSVEDFIRLFQRVLLDGVERLLAVPGTAVRRAQPRHNRRRFPQRHCGALLRLLPFRQPWFAHPFSLSLHSSRAIVSTGDRFQATQAGATIHPMPEPSLQPRRSAGAKVFITVALLLPYAALCFPALYARATPALFGFPFFYWYQFAWVVLTSLLLLAVYRALKTR